MIKIEHNAITDEIVEIELSAEEVAEIQQIQETNATAIATAEAEAATKAAEKAALLTRLGITADEAKLLLG